MNRSAGQTNRVSREAMGPCKERNETETKRNETKQIETKRNKSKRKKSKRNKSIRNETNNMAAIVDKNR